MTYLENVVDRARARSCSFFVSDDLLQQELNTDLSGVVDAAVRFAEANDLQVQRFDRGTMHGFKFNPVSRC